MPARLSDRLLLPGRLPIDTVRAAIARQAVYGGALDTALLELEVLDEGAVWDALAEATGLEIPDRALCEAPEKPDPSIDATRILDGAWSERCRAVPVGMQDGALAFLCGEPVAHGELDSAAAVLGIPFKLFVAPEIWVAAVRQAVFGLAMPPRLVRLFARVVGAHPVRRWQAAYAPAPVPAPPAAKDDRSERQPVPPEPPAAPLDGDPPPPLEGSPSPPAPTAPVPAAPPAPPEGPAAPGVGAVDPTRVSDLIEQLAEGRQEREAARAALVELTKQDLGAKPKRWSAWWEEHQHDDRIWWLFEGLSHKKAEIRASSEEELRALTGKYFGYHYDLPRGEREAARVRWQDWWIENRSRNR